MYWPAVWFRFACIPGVPWYPVPGHRPHAVFGCGFPYPGTTVNCTGYPGICPAASSLIAPNVLYPGPGYPGTAGVEYSKNCGSTKGYWLSVDLAPKTLANTL
eukprot:157261-Rhodomonas_salina.2